MITKRKIFSRIIVIFACIAISCSAFAVTDAPLGPPRNGQSKQQATNEPDQRPRRTPPQAAIKACEGKKEADPCTFTSPDGTRDGECLSGVENVFACRPHPGASSQKPVTSRQPRQPEEALPVPTQEQQTEHNNSPQSGTRTLPRGDTEPAKPLEPPPDKPYDHQANPPQKESHEPQDQADREPLAGNPALPPPLPTTGFFDAPGNYVSTLGSCLIVAIITAGLTWYGFFRYSTVPLRRLRKVTQQLAGGDLSARVGEGLVHLKNEVADLGRDVDRMAERTESLVGAHQRLIRDVSHELRSPLARLNVALELARQSAGPSHSAPFDRIERESDRLNELIGQLLMLTKLENDSGTIKRTDIDISALISEVAQDVDFEVRSNDRRVVTTVSEPMLLNGNKELLRQALENLVRNAARYTATGTEVEISLHKKEYGGRRWAHIEVRDQGPGVPESELYDIFRPFYRVNDARERQSGGTGVGLAISDRAVRLHGGSLRAFNAPGVGLIMEMELPLGHN
jgi:two-component system sensor histidine kinase CpxA